MIGEIGSLRQAKRWRRRAVRQWKRELFKAGPMAASQDFVRLCLAILLLAAGLYAAAGQTSLRRWYSNSPMTEHDKTQGSRSRGLQLDLENGRISLFRIEEYPADSWKSD